MHDKLPFCNNMTKIKDAERKFLLNIYSNMAKTLKPIITAPAMYINLWTQSKTPPQIHTAGK